MFDKQNNLIKLDFIRINLIFEKFASFPLRLDSIAIV